MIQEIKVNDKQYPFYFSFRAIFGFMNSSGIQSMEEAEEQVSMDYDALLSLYEKASQQGVNKDDDFEDDALTADELEEAIEDNPNIFMELQEAFNESKALKAFMGEDEEEKK